MKYKNFFWEWEICHFVKLLLTRKIPPQTWIDGTNGSKFWLKAFFLPQAFLTAVQLNFARTMSEVSKKQKQALLG